MNIKYIKSKFLRPGLFLLAVLVLTGACSKYDEGPFMSLYSKEKRVQGRWYFSSVKYNDVDSTDAYRVNTIHALEFFSNPEKDANWSAYTWMITAGLAPRTDYGFWRFTDKMDSLLMVTTIKSWPGGDMISDTVRYDWKINRLAYTDFWLERMIDDTTKVVWKLWKLAY